eukprot:544566-Amphidinium_carterae.1
MQQQQQQMMLRQKQEEERARQRQLVMEVELRASQRHPPSARPGQVVKWIGLGLEAQQKQAEDRKRQMDERMRKVAEQKAQQEAG